MPPVEFEPTVSAGERPQTYALDRAAICTSCEKQLTSCPRPLFVHGSEVAEKGAEHFRTRFVSTHTRSVGAGRTVPNESFALQLVLYTSSLSAVSVKRRNHQV